MPAAPSKFVNLPGSARALLPNSRPAGSIDPDELASLTVRTRSRGDVAALEKEVGELYSKPLAERTYLSHAELSDRYGARPEDLDALEAFAAKHNLMVSHRDQARRSLVLSGRLGDLLNAFPANLHLYHHSTGPYRGRQGAICIPREFDGVITGVFGYDTRPKHKRPHVHRTVGLSGPGGDNGIPATDFAKRYRFPTNHEGKVLDGAGQCIAIIELGGGFAHADLQIYFNELGIPLPSVAAVSVDKARNRPTKTGAADGEVMLDIEVAGSVAPKAKIAVYFAPNQGNGFLDAINTAVHDTERKPGVISISWGGPEDPGDKQAIDAYHEVFMEAAALGVTVCAASGDHGVADLDGQHWDGKIHVDHPACDDYVLACGGTQVNGKGKGHDVVWNDETTFDNSPGGGGWAGGGGVSTLFPTPAYQAKAGVPVSLDTGKPGRGVPDIAMSATNYFTRVQGMEGASGGTSAVAPLMASLVALLNQAKGKPVGFLNPFLYAHPDAFTDVKSGNNGIKGKVTGYKAKAGWDACTGLGTPKGEAILEAL